MKSSDAHRRFFTSVLRSPEWARNVRVGANSPSLWPTICSEMNTGTCLRPSCTAIVWPTIDGKTVDVRDQVRIIRFSFLSFIDSIRLSSRSSTNGPFLLDLLNLPPQNFYGRSEVQTHSRSKCAAFSSFFLA